MLIAASTSASIAEFPERTVELIHPWGPGNAMSVSQLIAKAMGEFGATITFVSNIPGQTQTLPSAVYAFLQVPGGEAAATRLVLISIVIAMSALLLSEYVGRRAAARVAGS